MKLSHLLHLFAVWLIVVPGASASPYFGNVFISGIMDARPSDEPDPTAQQYHYKAVEFFSNIEISAEEMAKFSLLIVENSLSSGTPIIVPLEGNVGASEKSMFYAVSDAASFQNIYTASATGGSWQSRNRGLAANIQYSGSDLQVLNGNDVVQLLYYPDGVGGASPAEVLDTYGQVDYLGSPDGLPIFIGSGFYVWGYEQGWAYRNPNTSGSGSDFAPEDWVLSGPTLLENLTFSGIASAVPFATTVPEPAAASFIFLGALLLRRRLRHKK